MQRDVAGVNSPTGTGKTFTFNNEGVPTRRSAGVNSPRDQRGIEIDVEDDWDDEREEARAKFQRMTTTHKVHRGGDAPPPGFITSVSRPDDKKKEKTETQDTDDGWCSCFSMCFGGGTQEPDPIPPKKKAEPRREKPAYPKNGSQQAQTGTAGANQRSLITQVDERPKNPQQDPGPPAYQTESALVEPDTPARDIELTPAEERVRDIPTPHLPKNAFRNDDDDSSDDPKGILAPNKTNKKKTLVLDLDETLVHSSFRPVANPTFTIDVQIDNHVYKVYVLKRPYTDEFLKRVSRLYEVIIFTASLSVYADPLLDRLDKTNVINGRLFRDSCVMSGKNYVKDLSVLGRKLKNLIIVDNSPNSYKFQPTNAINCTSWFDDPKDNELLEMLPVLETTLIDCDDVRKVLDATNMSYSQLCQKFTRDTNLDYTDIKR